jgi:hypothetical protein
MGTFKPHVILDLTFISLNKHVQTELNIGPHTHTHLLKHEHIQTSRNIRPHIISLDTVYYKMKKNFRIKLGVTAVTTSECS